MQLNTYNLCYLHLRTTRTNVYITLTDVNGNVLIKLSSGMLKKIFSLKTLKKKILPSITLLLYELEKKIQKLKLTMKLVIIQTNGFFFYGPLKSLYKSSLKVFKTHIYTIVKTKKAHNGVRSRKKRRK